MGTCRLIMIVVCVTAVCAKAGILTDPNDGALQLALQFDLAGNATLINVSGEAVLLDGYEIWSDGDLLAPDAWVSIADAVAADPVAVGSALGTGALSFGEITHPSAGIVAELNLASHAAFLPGASWSIGKPSVAPSADDIRFYYHTEGMGGDKSAGSDLFLGAVQVVPEPATIGLLCLGALAGLKRRRA